jgi:hypothetical protein
MISALTHRVQIELDGSQSRRRYSAVSVGLAIQKLQECGIGNGVKRYRAMIQSCRSGRREW